MVEVDERLYIGAVKNVVGQSFLLALLFQNCFLSTLEMERVREEIVSKFKSKRIISLWKSQ